MDRERGVSPLGLEATAMLVPRIARFAGVAQMVELLTCNEGVMGSSPVASFPLRQGREVAGGGGGGAKL